MSYDRKNKRASQAALREAILNDPSSPQLQHQPNPNLPLSPRPQPATRPPVSSINSSSGIGRSLKNSDEVLGNGNVENRPINLATPSPQISNTPQLLSLSTPTIVEALTTSTAPVFETVKMPPPPKINTSYAYPNGVANSNPPNPNSNPNPSGLSQTLNPQFAAKGSSSVAGHVLLGQHGRRLSNNNQVSNRALSPPRMTPRKTTGYTASELLEASPSGSLPLALPASLPHTTNGHHGIFGTSPFSGSRALFMPSSYDSTDGDAFPRSPPVHRGLEEMRRSSSNTGWDRPAMLGFNPDDSALADEESDDEYEEGFLPSSLNDLLTPEEQRRRGSRIAGFNPFQNHSVPADLMLSNGRPSMNIPTSSSLLSPPQTQSRSLLSNTSFPINSPPWQETNNFLSISPQVQPQQPARPLYSQSYNPSSTSGFQPPSSNNFNQLPSVQNTSSFLSNYFSPGPPINLDNSNSNNLSANTLLTSPNLGSSLPGGLAAGLSTLHLIPASYTGDTPPQLSFLGPPSNQNSATSPSNGNGIGLGTGGPWGNSSPSSWGSSNNGLSAVGPGGKSRLGGLGGNVLSSTSSPLHQASSASQALSDAGGDDDEIQFDMDT